MEDTVPITFSTMRDDCKTIVEPEKSLKDHNEYKHSNEDLPSTSKCGKCEYNSVDEVDLNEHINFMHSDKNIVCDLCDFMTSHAETLTKHRSDEHYNQCPKCDFHTHYRDSFDLHLQEKHSFQCNYCNLVSKNERKHNSHTCRVYLENPTLGTLYTKEWINRNGCSAIYCSKKNKDVIWIHSSKCWTNEHPCYFAPFTLRGRKMEPGFLHHFEFSKCIDGKNICWAALKENMEESL